MNISTSRFETQSPPAKLFRWCVHVIMILFVLQNDLWAQRNSLTRLPATPMRLGLRQGPSGSPSDTNASDDELISEDEPSPAGVASGETLEAAWEVSLAIDHRLAARQADVNAAGSKLDWAYAEKLPNLSLDGSYSIRSNETAYLIDSPALPFGPLSFADSQREGFLTQASVILPIFTSQRIENSVLAADAQLSASQLDLNRYISDLKLDVARDFIAVLLAKRELNVAISAHDALKAHVRDVESLFEHHRVPRKDLLSAQVAESNARQNVYQALNSVDAACSAYNRRLGRPLSTEVHLTEPILEEFDPDIGLATKIAVDGRFELAGLAMQAKALRHEAQSKYAMSRPHVDVRGDYYFQENRFRNPEGIASLGIGVHWQAWDGGRNDHAAAELLHRADALMHQRADIESRIHLQVRTACLDIHEARRRIKATQQAVERAVENLRVVRKQYALEAATGTEVLDAVSRQRQAETNYFSARYNLAFAVIRLRNATGEL